MPKILLIDGVKFDLWTPSLEVEEFHPIIKEHAAEIFGSKSFFLDISTRLTSEAGRGSEPDGFVLDTLANRLYVVEEELSKHDPYKHINEQLTRFINGLDNPATREKIVWALLDEIEANRELKYRLEEQIGEKTHKWLSKQFSERPSIIIVIEEKTPDVEEACKILTKSFDTKILEVQTFRRQDAPTVHAHLFDALYETKELEKQESNRTEVPATPQVNTVLSSADMIEVFNSYLGKTYHAKFDMKTKEIVYEGKRDSPSYWANEIARRAGNPNPSINGKTQWKYKDSEGRVRLIKELYY